MSGAENGQALEAIYLVSFRQLPITLEDGETFGKGESMLSFDCWRARDDDVLKQPAEELKLNALNGVRRNAEADTDMEAEA